jgi:uncharacterized protein
VTNVAAFGAFVDIGVHQDGLVHVSAMSDRYVSDPREVVKSGDVVRVKVLSVDVPRKRISLTLRLEDPAEGGGSGSDARTSRGGGGDTRGASDRRDGRGGGARGDTSGGGPRGDTRGGSDRGDGRGGARGGERRDGRGGDGRGGRGSDARGGSAAPDSAMADALRRAGLVK